MKAPLTPEEKVLLSHEELLEWLKTTVKVLRQPLTNSQRNAFADDLENLAIRKAEGK